jgi:hypothetical protein
MELKDTNIRISGEAFKRLKAKKASCGASIKFMIDLALDCWLGKQKKEKK